MAPRSVSTDERASSMAIATKRKWRSRQRPRPSLRYSSVQGMPSIYRKKYSDFLYELIHTSCRIKLTLSKISNSSCLSRTTLHRGVNNISLFFLIVRSAPPSHDLTLNTHKGINNLCCCLCFFPLCAGTPANTPEVGEWCKRS